MRAARTAVLTAAPAATVEARCVRSAQLTLSVIAKREQDGSEHLVFKTDQRNLFSKNRDRRKLAMEEIEQAVIDSARKPEGHDASARRAPS
mmetsp:Transcript_25595/g.52121  ORF Transcript_25595/g.52121 Transcript_25595/m.52121 type:complete len:91 (-) Transcript_25595:300-572(-)